jgi:hypothetical protein
LLHTSQETDAQNDASWGCDWSFHRRKWTSIHDRITFLTATAFTYRASSSSQWKCN